MLQQKYSGTTSNTKYYSRKDETKITTAHTKHQTYGTKYNPHFRNDQKSKVQQQTLNNKKVRQQKQTIIPNEIPKNQDTQDRENDRKCKASNSNPKINPSS